MLNVTDALEATHRDAAGAAGLGRIGDVADRSGAVLVESVSSGDRGFARSSNALSVAIAGPGLFVLETGGVRLYGRLGDFRFDGRGEMTDGKGRIVLGWPSGTAGSQALAPIRLPLGQKPDDVSIDAAGNIGAVRANGSRIGFGRIALAIFPAPQRLVRASDETLSATRGSGMPRYFRPAEPGVGSLRSHALETGLVDLEADFKRLWMLRRAGEFQVATAKASDACAATALDLVK